MLLNIPPQKKKQYPVVPQELIACQRCKKMDHENHFPLVRRHLDLPSFFQMSCMNSSSKVGQGHNSERVELNFIDYRTSTGSVLEVGISELSRFCRNFDSYVSIIPIPCLSTSFLTSHQNTAALPMPSVHE